MSKGFELIADFREDAGKGASRRLRREGKVPAIMYGGGKPPRSLSFDSNTLLNHMAQEAFFSSVLTVKVGDKEQPSVLKDVQMHPAKRQIVHIDLQRIVATEKIRMSVPFHFLNEETAQAVKLGGGTVSHLMSEIEVSCLPKDLPEYIEVDVQDLELDQILHLSEISIPEGVEIPDLINDNDQPVVTIHILKVAVEPEPEEEEVAEGEAAEASEEGEAKEEGEKSEDS